VSLGPSGCPPITGWGARQAGQYQAAEAKTCARTVDATWAWRQRPRPSPMSGGRSAAGNNGKWLHTARPRAQARTRAEPPIWAAVWSPTVLPVRVQICAPPSHGCAAAVR
jgi:hypothetical protein